MSPEELEPGMHLQWRGSAPVNLRQTLSILQRGVGDPTIRLQPSEAWLAFTTSQGDATLRIVPAANRQDFRFSAWGPGAARALQHGSDLLGARDDWTGFDAPEFAGTLPDLVRRSRATHRQLRLPRTGRVFDHAAGAVLEQRVTGIEANYAWRWLIRYYGRPAPGPAPEGLRLFPLPEHVAGIPRWQWQQARVEQTRAATLIRLSQAASRLERWAELELSQSLPGVAAPGTLEAALLSISGIGPWTVAETLQRSHGATDHVSVGDYHLSGFVGQLLVGRRIDDADMIRLLEPYTGHRQRVIRLLQLSGQRKQAFGPRYAPEDHRNR
ncbi:3-methyladenine DNA glycosylase [Glutamicibacter sp. MNS18]|uniref:DNA-3-methyladenine glycosylase family protein n=1 Tax=Glutamicibacter sp. MNS18 TaxID=2989817 RepID=UPI0022355AFE|nr:3-methyladenine DNA glycosylase [Glutamicibacter sp. MNS18]MCW4464101.1 3-methyladenine DNA glycosylase [Glutamicibacter sp. MNS18]